MKERLRSRVPKSTVVVIGGGGREAALVHKYSQSSRVENIIAIPGNDFMQMNFGKEVQTHPELKTTSVQEILEICKRQNVSLVDVAQDNAVAVGLVNRLIEAGIPVVGPTREAGEIEWNKAFSRELLEKLGVPQPEFTIFTNPAEGIQYLHSHRDQAWFVKASGLAEGKGALPAKNNQEAIERIHELAKFGDASSAYLLEEWLTSDEGEEPAEEFSAFAAVDGKGFKILGYAQDHKRAFDNDEGENTGGMGCSTPPLVVDQNIEDQVQSIFAKTIDGLKQAGRPYKGILYLGGMIVKSHGAAKVYVVEFNARWGDPEAQVIVPSIQNDFVELSEAIIYQELSKLNIQVDQKNRVAVAGAAKGYPVDYSAVKGKTIYGLEDAMNTEGVTVYGAGIKRQNNHWVVNGGRVVYAVGEGENVLEAREKAYVAMNEISIEGGNLHYRTDIGYRDVKRMN